MLPAPSGQCDPGFSEAFVVAHVEGDTAVASEAGFCGLVLEAAQRGALARGRRRVLWVDLHHPAEAVGLVGLLADVEAVVETLLLARARAGREAVAGQASLRYRVGDDGGVAEILVEVLLAGQHRAPRVDAAAAVVQGVQDCAAGRVGVGLEQVAARGRASETDRGGGG